MGLPAGFFVGAALARTEYVSNARSSQAKPLQSTPDVSPT